MSTKMLLSQLFIFFIWHSWEKCLHFSIVGKKIVKFYEFSLKINNIHQAIIFS